MGVLVISVGDKSSNINLLTDFPITCDMDMPSAYSRRGFLAALGVSAVAGCLEDDSPDPRDAWTEFPDMDPPAFDFEAPTTDPNLDVEVEPVIENLEIPWDLDHDSDGNLWLTERTGQILRFDSEDVEEVGEPADPIDAGIAEDGWWVPGGEGGTMGIAVSPDDQWLYLYYTAQDDGFENRIVRYPIEDGSLGEEDLLIDDIPADDTIHNGGRIAFGPDEYLWITTGDADDVDLSRSPESLGGKILRVDLDGEAAPDNPDHGGDDRIYAAGIRNSQGIDWLPGDVPVITDHGPTGYDAISILYPAGDYGWPEVRGDNEDNYAEYPHVVPPIALAGGLSWATSGSTWYDGDDVPSWSNRYIVGLLTRQKIFVVTITPDGQEPPAGGVTFDVDHYDDGATATVHEVLEDEIGRVRHVEQGPNGELYALTSNWDGRAEDPFPIESDDRVVRIVSE